MLVKLPLTQVFIKNIRDFYIYNRLYLVGCVRMNILYSSDTTFYDWKPLKSGLSGGRKSSVKSAKDWLSHMSLFHQNCYALVGSQVPIYAPIILLEKYDTLW